MRPTVKPATIVASTCQGIAVGQPPLASLTMVMAVSNNNADQDTAPRTPHRGDLVRKIATENTGNTTRLITAIGAAQRPTTSHQRGASIFAPAGRTSGIKLCPSRTAPSAVSYTHLRAHETPE